MMIVCARLCSLTIQNHDLELLVALWSSKIYTLIETSGKFALTLEDVSGMTLHLIWRSEYHGNRPRGRGPHEIEVLDRSNDCFQIIKEITYAALLNFFEEGDGGRAEFMVEAFLLYWLFWYVLPNGIKDALNLYVLPLAMEQRL